MPRIMPRLAPAAMSQVELSRKRRSSTALPTARVAVAPSTMAARPSSHVTTTISARAPTVTPSRINAARRDARRSDTNGPLAATSRKAGRKMPRVAMAAPDQPASR